MRRTPGRLLSLARRAATIASMQGRGGGKSGDSGVSNGGGCSEYVWVESGDVASLYKGFLDWLASLLTSSVGSILWGWVKSSLG